MVHTLSSGDCNIIITLSNPSDQKWGFLRMLENGEHGEVIESSNFVYSIRVGYRKPPESDVTNFKTWGPSLLWNGMRELTLYFLACRLTVVSSIIVINSPRQNL